MADDIQRLIVSLEARTAAFEKAMNRANGVANKRARAIESRFAMLNKRVGVGLGNAARGWVAGLAAVFGARGLKSLSDAATRIDNALKVAGVSGEELEKVYGKLRDSAIENAAPLESLVELYSRASLVQKELGVSSKELLGFTDNVAVALRVSGKSAQEASGALLQLSQALGSGAVRAEEFNSVQEGALPILQAAAAGLKEAGGSVAKLRQLVIDGKVSSEALFRAFEAGAPILERKVADAVFTVDQATNNLYTALIDVAREFNKSTGASKRFAEGINNAAKAIADFDVSGFIRKIEDAYDTLDRFLTDLGNAQIFDNLNRALGLMDGEGNVINLDAKEAQEKAAALERDITRLQDQISNFTKLGLDTSEAESRLSGLQSQLSDLRASMADMPAVLPRGSVIDGGYQATTDGGPRRNGPRGAVASAVSIKDFKAPSGKNGGKSKRANDYEREVEQIRERTAALIAETQAMAGLNPLVDDYGFAVEKARAAVELETAAKKAGLEVTPALKATIDELATTYANASVAAEQLAESQDMARQAAEDMRALGKDVLGGFIKVLRDGKSASEALAGALQKVADKLLEVALNSIFDGGGGGGFGGLLGGIGKIFGFAKGGVASRSRPLPTFARGGVSKSAAIFGEAGPEAAVPLPDGRRIPVDLRIPNGGKDGGTSKVMLQLSPGLEASILEEARGQAIGIVEASQGATINAAASKAVRDILPGGKSAKSLSGAYNLNPRSRRAG
ncbi:MAG: hypothetical protein CL535_16320 [Ahrensia sp.]|nr:hypothetical protein [Ahrensia sp.]MBV48239.1 hypothetical protein [Roseobacter sp.]|tara:strand:- start:117713 stop:119926 length:2214 start_codon:yes stop_codon:yes gene_type:complete